MRSLCTTSPAVLFGASSLACAGVSGSATAASWEGGVRWSELPGKFDGGRSSSYRARSRCLGREGCCCGSCSGGVRGGLFVSVGPDGGNTLADDLSCLSSQFSENERCRHGRGARVRGLDQQRFSRHQHGCRSHGRSVVPLSHFAGPDLLLMRLVL